MRIRDLFQTLEPAELPPVKLGDLIVNLFRNALFIEKEGVSKKFYPVEYKNGDKWTIGVFEVYETSDCDGNFIFFYFYNTIDEAIESIPKDSYEVDMVDELALLYHIYLYNKQKEKED